MSLVRNQDVFCRETGEHLPLYEAKMVHHFDHRWASYQVDGAPIKMRQFIFTHTSGPVPRHAVLGVGGVQ